MFDEHALRVIEYPLVRSLIARNAVSGMGHDLVESTTPMTDRVSLERRMQEVDEMVQAVRWGDPVPLRGVVDIRQPVELAAHPGARLDPPSLLDIAQTLEAAGRLRGYFAARTQKYPRLEAISSALEPCPELVTAVNRAIDPGGFVRDSASPALAKTRRELEQARSNLRANLERLVHSLASDVLTERVVAWRNGRPVIPVRAQRRNTVGGIVHDESASGQTVFVEPFESVEDANRIRRLEIAEQAEVDRILSELTGVVFQHSPRLRVNLQILGRLDALYALGVYADQADAAVPGISDDGALEIVRMRHPLLDVRLRGQKREAVPLTCRLRPDDRLMLISGPNAGGKTVALKTIGLAIAMTQSGFPIPADPLTTLPVFESFFAEIGDEQSIENDLSTFSSRIGHLARISAEAGKGTLILVDELGSSTDPDQGAALSRALLERWFEKGARTVATTHLGSLKEFAHEMAWAVNASMEFDRDKLNPTFRLVAGIPGSSYAFEISRRIGLAEDIIARAEHFLGRAAVQTERLIADLTFLMEQTERRLREIESRERALAEREREYEDRFARVVSDRKRMAREAREEAEKILADARALVERTVADIRRTNGDRESIKSARATLQSALARTRSELADRGRTDGAEATGINPGNWVKIVSINKTGEVVAVSKDRVAVQTGGTRLEVRPDQVEKIAEKAPDAGKGGVSVTSTASDRFLPEVDVRGMSFDDAWAVLDRYLDDACVARYPRVRIIHGKGTGVLRRRINEQLKQDERVASHQMGEYYEGGAGVTVVDMKLD